MNFKQTPLLLISIMAVVISIVAGSSVYLLYQSAFEQQRARLIEVAQSRGQNQHCCEGQEPAMGFAAYDLCSDDRGVGGCVVMTLGNEIRPIDRPEPGGSLFGPGNRVECADLRPIRRTVNFVLLNCLSCAAQKPLVVRIGPVARERLRDFVGKSLGGVRHQPVPDARSGT